MRKLTPSPINFRRHPAMLGEHLLDPHRHHRAGARGVMGVIINKKRVELMVADHPPRGCSRAGYHK